MRTIEPRYIITPSYLIADIGKVGSSTIFREVLSAHYPNVPAPVIVGADFSNRPDNGMRRLCPRTTEVDRPVILLVREPVERFVSACSQSRIKDVDGLLTKLETGGSIVRRDVPAISSYHFRPTSDYIKGGGEYSLFKFPDHLDDAASLAGLKSPMPVVNDSNKNNPEKPTLTASQLQRVKAIYADDILLFDSVTEAGRTHTPPVPEPTSAELKAEAIKVAHAAAAAAFEALPLGKQALLEGVRVKVSEAILAGDTERAVEILRTTPTIYNDADDDRDAFINLII